MSKIVDQMEFLCTRPRLAALLISKGYEAEQTINPFRPSMTAWIFQRDDQLNDIVDQFYEELNRKRTEQEDQEPEGK